MPLILKVLVFAYGGAAIGYGFFGDHPLSVWGGFIFGLVFSIFTYCEEV